MNRYAVSEVILLNQLGEEHKCSFILDNDIPDFTINRWLEYKGRKSLATSRKYAYSLCQFLNFLQSIGVSYSKATKKDVFNYIDGLLFGNSDGVLQFNSNITYKTASSHLTTIKEFYKYLEDTQNSEISITFDKVAKRSSKHSYLYGQIWDMDAEEFLSTKLPRLKSGKPYIKWYSEEEKTAFLSQFNTLRDKAIFALTLEGMRIDEVISMKIDDYDANGAVIHLKHTKGNKERIVPLKEETVQLIENYLYTERSLVEAHLGIVNDFMFINLKKGKAQGQPVGYRNVLNIIKTAGKNAGMNPEKIRTHSGRSTRTMELLQYQAEHPEANLTDEQIRLLMGWSSSKSLEPYINHKDEKTLVTVAKKINRKE